ncbi:thiol-disulfide oxidoreductase DCC family protein [Halalkalibacter nanhaiisediminis]|uniref:Putative DCC family thiol-disulfide oxidoreductase YuxK n=1 Tax=Halalkalibacter nanhaiisediminis TaxID=688079 RepID=A0A562QEK4_9BACI|nr:DCC1-like thiol-disulfide oxidoreductase family protein [Halalkalibacter nanhaiisediminis]TWI54476.1 putative DCC family thiol-disulfide oxidoreductase YuxK [Halalkalibacter nanhaiisediminis]
MKQLHTHQRPILLFDGECNVCNHLVDFMLRYERKQWFLFASLQSKEGQRLVADFDIPENVDSVIVLIDGRVYLYSDAVFEVARVLPWYLRWMRIFRVIPTKWRNKGYKHFAKNRYRWFGKRETCRLPTVDEKSRFLE